MKIIKQLWTYKEKPSYTTMLLSIEEAARTCYASVPLMYNENIHEREMFIQRLIKRGHLSPLEHESISLYIVTDRAVLSELSRHRLISLSVQSQRYVKYNDIEFILPVWFYDVDTYQDNAYLYWQEAMRQAEITYNKLLFLKQQPQQARMVLPNSTSTEFVITANLREWRLILSLRSTPNNNPQMEELMKSILEDFKASFPIFFEDIND